MMIFPPYIKFTKPLDICQVVYRIKDFVKQVKSPQMKGTHFDDQFKCFLLIHKPKSVLGDVTLM